MLKNTVLLGVLIPLLGAQFACGMDLTLPRRSPKSLYQYFDIECFEFASKDIKNELLAKRIIGDSGWWYKSEVVTHSKLISTIAFNPQGNCFATASFDNTACLWDLKGQKLVTVVHGDWVRELAFHPQGALLATASDDRTVCLRGLNDKKNKELRILRHSHAVCALKFNKEGNILATSTVDGRVWLWGINGSLLNLFKVSGWGLVLAFNPQEDILATGSIDNKIRLIDLKGTVLRTIKCGKDEEIDDLAFHPEGNILASAAQAEGIVHLRNLNNNTLVALPHDKPVNAVRFHPAGTIVATASRDGTVCLWDLQGTKLRTLPHDHEVNDLAFGPQGNILVSACENEAHVWQQHQHPTLEQVLLRCVLKNYLIDCIKKRVKPEIACTSQNDFVPWMVERFNLKEDELQEAWKSMPVKLREGIINTLLYRSKLLVRLMQENHTSC